MKNIFSAHSGPFPIHRQYRRVLAFLLCARWKPFQQRDDKCHRIFFGSLMLLVLRLYLHQRTTYFDVFSLPFETQFHQQSTCTRLRLVV